MRNIIVAHKIEGVKTIECYVDVDRIIAIENPVGNTFRMFLESGVWDVNSADFNHIMSIWVPYYKSILSKCKHENPNMAN